MKSCLIRQDSKSLVCPRLFSFSFIARQWLIHLSEKVLTLKSNNKQMCHSNWITKWPWYKQPMVIHPSKPICFTAKALVLNYLHIQNRIHQKLTVLHLTRHRDHCVCGVWVPVLYTVRAWICLCVCVSETSWLLVVRKELEVEVWYETSLYPCFSFKWNHLRMWIK